MDIAGGGGRAEAERWLAIAEKLLAARDLVGSKRFAERALASSPLLDGVDQVLAVADVLLAAQRHRVSDHPNWYSVLGLARDDGGVVAGAGDPTAVARNYRRLALLLHPDRNRSYGADAAFRLVVDAFATLSDPQRRALFDAELRSSSKPSSGPTAASDAAGAGDPFWTACPSCCHVHQYSGAHKNLSLRCPTCRRPFLAAELPSPPPIVAGTNMYYCSWGFFPLGFAPDLGGGGGGGGDWKPFFPMFPWSRNPPQPPTVDPPHGESEGGGKKATAAAPPVAEPLRAAPLATRNKKLARKKVGGGVKRMSFPGNGGNEPATAINLDGEEAGGINTNEEAKCFGRGVDLAGDGDDPVSFHIDLDATDEVLGNLQNLPFLKDEEIPAVVRMPFR